MKAGDKIILDSGFGWEIGYYMEDGETYYHVWVHLISGILQAETCRMISEIKPYTPEMAKIMEDTYKTFKSFP